MSMDNKKIQELIKLVSKTGISEVSIEQKDFKLTIKSKQEAVPVYAAAPAPVAAQPAAPAPVAEAAPVNNAGAPAEENPNLITIKSPMIGTFYKASSPDKPAFVNVGDEINPGKVLCILEAMKLFNEIESEVSGKVVKILVNDAEPVEFDQPLFIVDPS